MEDTRESNVAMAKVKIFRFVRTFLETLGFYSSQTSQFHSFKLRALALLACVALGFLSIFAFFIFQAKSFQVIFEIPFFVAFS